MVSCSDMRNALVLVLIMIVLTVFSLSAAGSPAGPWSETYGGSGTESGHGAIGTADGGAIVVGSTTSFGAVSTDLWLLKLDDDGEMEWNATFGGSNEDIGSDVIQLDDGSYLVSGSTLSFAEDGWDMWLLKVDENGNEEWNTTFDESDRDMAHAIHLLGSGKVVMAGEMEDSPDDSDLWVLKLHQNGSEVWSKTYGGGGNEVGHDICNSSTDDIIVAGFTSTKGSGKKDMWLTKILSNGNQVWDKAYGGYADDIAHAVNRTSDDGFIVTGSTRSGAGGSNCYIVKTTSSGSKSWTTVVGERSEDLGLDVLQDPTGGYLVSGSTRWRSDLKQDSWLIALEDDGDEILNATFGHTGADEGFSMIMTDDDGIWLLSNSTSGPAGGADIALMDIGELRTSSGTNDPPGTPSKPDGPSTANHDEAVEFTTASNDPDGDLVRFEVEWDVDDTTFTNYYLSGDDATLTHSWKFQGSKDIKVKAVDMYGGESGWSSSASVDIRSGFKLGDSESYGGTANETLLGMEVTDGEDHYLLAEVSDGADPDHDILLIKLDSGGDEVWTETIGGDGADVPRSMVLNGSGRPVIIGSSDEFANGTHQVPWLFKLDGSGNELWSMTFLNGTEGYGMDIHRDGDNAFLVSMEDRSYYSDAVVARVFDNGTEDWNVTLNVVTWDHANEIAPCHDDFIIADNQANGVRIYRATPNGSIVWNKVLGNSEDDKVFELLGINDRDFLAIGVTDDGSGNPDGWITRIDDNGNIDDEVFFGSDGDDLFLDARRLSEGGFLLSGTTDSFGSPDPEMWLFRVNGDLDEVWNLTLASTGNQSAGSAMTLGKDSFIIAGDTDNGGQNTDVTTTIVQLRVPPGKPTVYANETTTTAGEDLEFIITSVDINEDRVFFEIEWGDGSSEETNYYDSGEMAFIDHEYDYPGTYEVRARAEEAGGARSEWSKAKVVTITSNPPKRPMNLDGPASGTTGVEYEFTVSTTDPDGDDLTYTFDWDDSKTDWAVNISSGSTATISHAWTSPGWYNITVKANDIHGLDTTWSPPHMIHISSNPPAKPTLNAYVTKGFIDRNYHFTASSTDPDDNRISYKFNWGDGNDHTTGNTDSGETVNVSHRWTSTGNYNVRVKAIDTTGAESDWSSSLLMEIGDFILIERPSKPLDLAATLQGTSVHLEWEPPEDDGNASIEGYNVYRSTSPVGGDLLDTVNGSTSYDDPTAVAGYSYYYTVKAVNSAGESKESKPASVTIPAPKRGGGGGDSPGFEALALVCLLGLIAISIDRKR